MSGSDLSGDTVVVTGGAGGMGLSTSLAFLERGARVVVVDFSAERCDAFRAVVGQGDATVIAADLASDDGIAEVGRRLEKEPQAPTVLVNIAGRVVVKPFLDCARDDWMSLFEMNVVSMAQMSRLVLPAMIARGGGSIVNMASLSGRLATPLESMYCVTKAAIAQLTKAIAVEYRGSGIRCNCVSPAMVDTAHGRSEIAALQAAGIPLTLDDVAAGQVRLANPGEIAAAIMFLATSASSFVSGAELVVDNAWSAGAGA